MFWVIPILLSIIGVCCWWIYDRLLKLKNRVERTWGDIEFELKKRHDLVTRLVETVGGYTGHDRDALRKVTVATAAAMNVGGVREKARAEDALSDAVRELVAVAQQYPAVKASASFMSLQKGLAEIESSVELAGRVYNSVVRDYNLLCESFPWHYVAGAFNFRTKPFFSADGVGQDVEPT